MTRININKIVEVTLAKGVKPELSISNFGNDVNINFDGLVVSIDRRNKMADSYTAILVNTAAIEGAIVLDMVKVKEIKKSIFGLIIDNFKSYPAEMLDSCKTLAKTLANASTTVYKSLATVKMSGLAEATLYVVALFPTIVWLCILYVAQFVVNAAKFVVYVVKAISNYFNLNSIIEGELCIS